MPELTLTRVGTVGGARKYVLKDDDGYERRFMVSECERAVDGDDGFEALRRAVARYWAEKGRTPHG
jgi:hypothetical protein